ncbi:MAG TPA: penicillin-binding transpeptidase domain-containing protein, partial [Solirubrobacteraceae bacterium]
DNSIYAEVGLKVGTHRIAHLAHKMGITTPISTNPAMTIGGLKVGVTPLDMAHAYETIAHGGDRVSGTMALDGAPTGIKEVDAQSGQTLPDGHHRDTNRLRLQRVLPSGVASTETSVLETVLQYGTARAAAIGQFAAGKTGTTSNYGDAWFVGWDGKYTVAVWVGYPDSLVPMTTQFQGGPVLGGTFPALIWHNFMLSALQIESERAHKALSKKIASQTGATEEPAESTVTSSTSSKSVHAPGSSTPTEKEQPHGGGAPKESEPAGNAPPSAEPTPATTAPAAPTPAPSTPSPSGPPTSNAGGTGAPTGGTGAGN